MVLRNSLGLRRLTIAYLKLSGYVLTPKPGAHLKLDLQCRKKCLNKLPFTSILHLIN